MGALLYRSLAASIGVGLGAAAVLLLILMLRLLLGPFDVLAGDAAPSRLHVGLWEPASSAAEPDWQRTARRERWHAVLPAGAELQHSAQLATLTRWASVVTQHFGDAGRIDVLAALAGELRARGAWLCTGSELASWWARRAQVDVSAVRTGPHRVHLIATNRGEKPVAELAVRLHPNSRIESARASATALFREEPEVRLVGDHVDVLLPELGAGSSRDYTLDLLITPSDSSLATSAAE